jgi:hypothetical protein
MQAAPGTLSSKPRVMSHKNALASNRRSQQTMIVNTTKNTRNVTSSTWRTMAASALVKLLLIKKWNLLVQLGHLPLVLLHLCAQVRPMVEALYHLING